MWSCSICIYWPRGISVIYGSEKNKLQKNVFIRFQFCKTRTKIIPTFVLRKSEEEREGVRDKEEERKWIWTSLVVQWLRLHCPWGRYRSATSLWPRQCISRVATGLPFAISSSWLPGKVHGKRLRMSSSPSPSLSLAHGQTPIHSTGVRRNGGHWDE